MFAGLNRTLPHIPWKELCIDLENWAKPSNPDQRAVNYA